MTRDTQGEALSTMVFELGELAEPEGLKVPGMHASSPQAPKPRQEPPSSASLHLSPGLGQAGPRLTTRDTEDHSQEREQHSESAFTHQPSWPKAS